MRIGIDISQIVYQTGVSNYTKNLVDKILEIDKKNEYVLFGGSLRQQEKLKQFVKDSGQARMTRLSPTILDFLWNKLHILNFETLVGKVDVYHSSDWTQAPSKAKIIAPIYDMVVYKYPETSHPSIITTQKRRMEWVKKEADIIVTISESSKQDIHEILNIPLEKIRVVYPSISDEYKSVKLQKFKKNYFLAVGTREPRKNFARLIEAFQKANIKDTELWIVGKPGWGDLPTNNNIKFLGFVNQEKMPGFYANAKAFIYPSLYEGFGIPILEAMACGCPVITSNVSSMPEAGGEAAIYVDPLDIDDISKKIKFVMDSGRPTAVAGVARMTEQVNKFSWEKSAKEMIKIYEELYSSR